MGYQLYFDESNNFRSLRLKESDFNVGRSDIFVLGGVAIKNKVSPEKIAKLKKDLNINDNSKEIKFKHIAHGDMFKILSSRKLNTFLKFLLEEEMLIHFYSIDGFYFGMSIDIIESLPLDNMKLKMYEQSPFCHDTFKLKDIFNRVAYENREKFISLYKEYNVPDLYKDKRNDFLDDVISLINNSTTITSSDKVILSDCLSELYDKEITFLEDFRGGSLIDTLGQFYKQIIKVFNKSFKNYKMFFDREIKVEKELEDSLELEMKIEKELEDSLDCGVKVEKELEEILDRAMKVEKELEDDLGKNNSLDYKFIDSSDFYIQLSDVVCGLICKIMTDIRNMSCDEILMKMNNLSEIQKENIRMIKKLINLSLCEDEYFVYRTVSISEKIKFDKFFMHDDIWED